MGTADQTETTSLADLVPEQPVPVAETGERIASLDFIRGIAVMGILAANIFSMAQPIAASFYPGAFLVPHSGAEDWMWLAQLVLIDGKMRGLFALLFGAGLCLFIERARAHGGSRMLQMRRLGWLALFGLGHFYFVWQGDILFAYAISGMVLTLFFLDFSPKTLLVLGLLGHLAGAIFYMATLGSMQWVVDSGEPDSAVLADVRGAFAAAAEDDLADGRTEAVIRQEGSYGEFVAHTAMNHGTEPFWGLSDLPFEVLPSMLLGMALYRMGLFGRASGSRRGLWVAWLVLAGGAAVTAMIGWLTLQGGLTYHSTMAAIFGWTHIPRVAMVVALAILLTAFAASHRGRFVEAVSAAGRAAFTNYLGTSIVMLFVFGNWGLDLFGRLGRAELYAVVVLAWTVMLLWSSLWLARFRYGPLEWLWRCLTYGKRFPLRR